MTFAAPLNSNDTPALLARTDPLGTASGGLAGRLGRGVDYSFDMMLAARKAGIRSAELLEMLVELEAIKYTLCARRLRGEQGE